ncbi:MAG: hypothetical protein MI784_17670, partial [Cytophagales bacterium]|nr:hypothetical protein [Cytophagales bacterium]
MKALNKLLQTALVGSLACLVLAIPSVDAAITLPAKSSPRVVAGTDYIASPTYAFDEDNRPYFLLARTLDEFGQIETIRNSGWIKLNFREAWNQWIAQANIPNLEPQVGNEPIFTAAIDAENSYYAVVRVFNRDQGDRWESVVIYSPNITATTPEFKFYRFTNGGTGESTYRSTAFVELNNSGNARTVTVDGETRAVTPAIYLTKQVADQAYQYHIPSQARLYLPVKKGSELELGEG